MVPAIQVSSYLRLVSKYCFKHIIDLVQVEICQTGKQMG